ncbi:Cytosol nonspecific dipeptidase (EC [Olavius algarvensis associated proteobacterium Delta 3]|nr:Cytosol nonspecific dipeptidase (EC [Olavius algarvensis associated proteobacterium Delta 3]
MGTSTENIIEIFELINQIPRCSKQEEKISEWLHQWARAEDFHVTMDQTGNMLITVPATPGCEESPVVVIQGHMDMVCEKRPDSAHDFNKDPIRVVRDGEWLRADGTTLGADNGIALAMAMALVTDSELKRPPIELLFTVDEETGLTGAMGMDANLVSGRVLINIDSEDEGEFTIGCAGGTETRISLPLGPRIAPGGTDTWKLVAGGMRGGHSGIDIHKHRANAIKLTARTLEFIYRNTSIWLVSLAGGKSQNAIPREATAKFAADSGKNLEPLVSDFEKALQKEYELSDSSLFVTLEPVPKDVSPVQAFSEMDTRKVLAFLLSLPDGVDDMSAEIEDLVETSSNLAKVELKKDALEVISSQRSSVMSKLDEITVKVESVAVLAGTETRNANEYPSWAPDLSSPLLHRCRSVYQELFKKKPKVKALHAGLECGVIGAKCNGMDMISIGPTIRNPHSPDESLNVPSVGKVWEFLVALLKSYAEDA